MKQHFCSRCKDFKPPMHFHQTQILQGKPMRDDRKKRKDHDFDDHFKKQKDHDFDDHFNKQKDHDCVDQWKKQKDHDC